MNAANSSSLYKYTGENGISGFLAINTTVRHRSSGGVRLQRGITAERLSELAYIMTLKHGFVGVPVGGAKAAITLDETASPNQRADALREFALKFRDPIRSMLFTPGSDMGSFDEDIQLIMSTAGRALPRRRIREELSGLFTAYSMVAGLKFLASRSGTTIAGMSAIVEGFGKVGRGVLQLFEAEGITVKAMAVKDRYFVAPVPLPAAEFAQRMDRNENLVRITREEFLRQPAEVLAICGIGDFLTAADVPQLSCRFILPGANIPYPPETERLLLQKGILCLPDFVSNCGGVAGKVMQFGGLSTGEIRTLIETRLGRKLHALLPNGINDIGDARRITENAALEQFESLKRQVESRSPKNFLLESAFHLHRAQVVPLWLVRKYASVYFQKSFFRLPADRE